MALARLGCSLHTASRLCTRHRHLGQWSQPSHFIASRFAAAGKRNIHATAYVRSAVGLVFASQCGTTEEIAERISKMTGLEHIDIENVKEAADLAQYDALIVGTPTHNTLVEEYRSGTGWDDIIDDIKGLDLTGKVVAVFGSGDSVCYGEGFCDAMEELHRTFKTAGATMIGYVDSSNYQHEFSKCDIDGQFVGLALDEMNEDDLTGERLETWVAQLKKEGMPI